jgi:hypothetical protein
MRLLKSVITDLEVSRNGLMRLRFTRPSLGTAGVLALVGGALFGSLPASAATISAADCQAQSGTYAVRAVSISQGDSITLYQTGTDGHFEGQGTVEVFCRKGTNNLGDIDGAQVRITVTPESGVGTPFSIQALNGVATTGANPVIIGPFTGSTDFLISAPNSLLPAGTVAANVATQIEVVTAAWGGTLTDPGTGKILGPGTFGDVIAQTPELDSLPLFATGALGLLGYAQMRRRARK